MNNLLVHACNDVLPFGLDLIVLGTSTDVSEWPYLNWRWRLFKKQRRHKCCPLPTIAYQLLYIFIIIIISCCVFWRKTFWAVGEPPFSCPWSPFPFTCCMHFLYTRICTCIIHNDRVLFKQPSHQESTQTARYRPVSFGPFNHWLPQNRRGHTLALH